MGKHVIEILLVAALRFNRACDHASSTKKGILICLCLTLASSGFASENTCDQLVRSAERHFLSAQTDSSIVVARRALACRRSEVGEDDTATASLYLLISKYQFAAEKYVASDSSARKAAGILMGIWGYCHPELLRALVRLAATERNTERSDKADALLHGIVALVKIHCYDAAIEADAHTELGIGHRFRNEFDSSRVYFDKATSIYDLLTGDFREQRQQIEISCGRILVWESRYAEAEEVFESLIRGLSSTCARDSLTLAELRYHLGQAHRMLGKYSDAEEDEKATLSIRIGILGTYHYLNGEADHVLGMVYQDQGDYYNAKRLLEQALRIFRLTVGEKDWRVGGVLRNLARLHDELGASAEAESLYLAAVSNRERALNPRHPGFAQVVMELATFYVKQRNNAKAEELLRRTLTVFEKAFKPDHEAFAVALDGLG